MTNSSVPTLNSLKDVIPALLANYAGQHFDVGIANAASRLPILYKSGRIQKSLETVRQNLDINILDIEEDFYPGPDNGDINIWNTSQFLNQLSEDDTKRLMESVIGALRQLSLPLMLIENYITALLYNSEIKPTLLPTTMFGDLFLVDKFKDLNLTTQDKKFYYFDAKHHRAR